MSQQIAHEIISEGMVLDDQFQVAVIIDKLFPVWKDFKNALTTQNQGLLTRKSYHETKDRG